MLKFTLPGFSKILSSLSIFLMLGSCSKVTELKVGEINPIRINTVAPITIVRTGTGSGEWNIGDRDGFNYYFSSYPSGVFQVEAVADSENDFCRTTESNEVNDGEMHNEVQREMLIKGKGKGEITIAVACHKKFYRFFAADSIINVQMIVEDADDNVRDTVVFKIVR